MNVLLVCWYFPPANTIAGVRLGRLAEYLLRAGHDVRIVSARDIPFPPTLQFEIPLSKIAYAPWIDIYSLPRTVARWLGKRGHRAAVTDAVQAGTAKAGNESPKVARPSLMRRQLRKVGSLYASVFGWPDPQIGWLPGAVGAGRRLVRSFQPDLVFASAPPFTTLLIGARLSKALGVPLVVEMRDRWSDDPYYPPGRWHQWLNSRTERKILSRARALVTVSEPWAATYRRNFQKPTAVVYNGYDPKILDRVDLGTVEQGANPDQDEKRLSIVYTGSIYPDRRDPSLLFEAISRLGAKAERVRVTFYGTDPDLVWPIAQRYGISGSIRVLPPIPHAASVGVQRRADVLLLMQWNDPKEHGNVPGKLFEYLGARRPILVLGLDDGVPATLIRERGAGVYGKSSDQIARQLESWLSMIDEADRIPDNPESSRSGFSRDEQYATLVAFIEEQLARP